jgi:hypothetical protein
MRADGDVCGATGIAAEPRHGSNKKRLFVLTKAWRFIEGGGTSAAVRPGSLLVVDRMKFIVSGTPVSLVFECCDRSVLVHRGTGNADRLGLQVRLVSVSGLVSDWGCGASNGSGQVVLTHTAWRPRVGANIGDTHCRGIDAQTVVCMCEARSRTFMDLRAHECGQCVM